MGIGIGNSNVCYPSVGLFSRDSVWDVHISPLEADIYDVELESISGCNAPLLIVPVLCHAVKIPWSVRRLGRSKSNWSINAWDRVNFRGTSSSFTLRSYLRVHDSCRMEILKTSALDDCCLICWVFLNEKVKLTCPYFEPPPEDLLKLTCLYFEPPSEDLVDLDVVVEHCSIVHLLLPYKAQHNCSGISVVT